MRSDDEITKPYTVEQIVARNVVATLEDRRQMLDELLEPLPENAEPCAPRAWWDGG
jgi:hypothetical protein